MQRDLWEYIEGPSTAILKKVSSTQSKLQAGRFASVAAVSLEEVPRPKTILRNSIVAFCGAGETIRVSNTTITRNETGLNAAGGDLLSRMNNTVEANDTDGSFTGTFVAK